MTIHDDEDDEEWTGLETSVSDTALVLWLLSWTKRRYSQVKVYPVYHNPEDCMLLT